MRTYGDLIRTPVTLDTVLNKYDNALTESDLPLMLYIDTPFCMKACKFCNCRPVEARCQGKEYKAYYPYLLNLINECTPLLMKHKPLDVYFGGGTPFFMDTPTMLSVFNSIPNFKDIPNKAIEGHPALLADSKLKLLIDYKFTYVSLGVQTFNKDILENQNRLGFDFDKTKRKIRELREAGIVVNCDIITYLESVDSNSLKIFRQDLEMVRELEPDLITCYYDFYQLKTYQDENQNLVEEDKFTLDAIRRYRSEMVKFCRKFNATLPVDFAKFLNPGEILKAPTYTTHIYLNGECGTPNYSCSGFPNFKTEEIALGLGGYEHHVTYGHIKRDYNYEIRLKDGEMLLEELT